MRRLQERYPNKLVIIGVHSAKFPSEGLTANIRQAVMRRGSEHPVVNDADFRIWGEYDVRAWPTLVLIDPRGRITGETAGEVLAEELFPVIDRVIAENKEILDTSPLGLTPESQAQPERPLRFPSSLLLGSQSRLWLTDSGHHRILEVQLDNDGRRGEIRRVFGNGRRGLRDGASIEAEFNHPHGLAMRESADQRTLYVADTGNHAVRAINLKTGEVRTVAGTGAKAHGSYSWGSPTHIPLRSPWALALHGDDLLIAMAGSHQIWVLSGKGELRPFAGNGREALVDGPAYLASFNQPSDLALHDGDLFAADPEASAVRLIQFKPEVTVRTLVGAGLFEFGDRDGIGTEARLQHPAGLAFANGLVYIADTYNHKIKTLDPQSNRVSTLIGTGAAGYANGSFEQTKLFEPEGVQTDGNRLYIADTNNHLLRMADLETHQVYAVELRGLEKLSQPEAAPAKIRRLEPVMVSPGDVRVTLEISLPSGYERNTETPAVVQVKDSRGRHTQHRFSAAEPLSFEFQAAASGEVPLGLTLYYCREGNAALCLIEDITLILAFQVSPNGDDMVRVPVKIEE